VIGFSDACVHFPVFTMTFAYLVSDWLVHVVWGGINQSRARFIKDIMNSEKCDIFIYYALLIYKLSFIEFNNTKSLTFPFVNLCKVLTSWRKSWKVLLLSKYHTFIISLSYLILAYMYLKDMNLKVLKLC
jgi:hypothetical protein